MKNKLIIIFILLLLGGMVSNSFAYKKVKCFILKKPAKLLPGVSKIAVLDFEGEGDHGRFLADQFIEELLKEDRGITRISGGLFGGGKEGVTHLEGATTRIYNIVERSALETVLKEQSLNMTGLVDDATISQVGKILGVDAIVSGTYTINSKDTRSKEEVSYYENKQKKTKIVDCITRKTSVTGSIRIIGVETAQIMATFSSDAVAEDKKCDTEIGSVATKEMQIHACMNTLSNAFTNYINPFFIKIEIELEKIKNSDFSKMADEAASAADHDDIDQAYLLYYAVYQDDPYNPAVLYNLGVLNEVAGNFQDASAMYANALQLDDDKRIKEAISRVDQDIELADVLSSVGIQLERHEFETSPAATAEISVEKVRIKGKRQDRIDVKESPLITSETIARVPGDIQLKIVQREAEWFKVELPDGKQGYIHEDNCVH